LYYAVTGKVPFPGGTSRDKARRHCEDTPLNPKRFNGELSDEFIDVIAAMMEKDPRKRISTCEEVVQRLAPWAHDAVATTIGDLVPTAPMRARAAEAIGDTQPGLFDDLPFGQDDSASQISQRTDAVTSSRHETLPDEIVAPAPLRPIPVESHSRYPVLLTLLVVIPLLLAGSLLVASMVLKALF
jgi:serine/threonine protein kinase